MNLCTLNQLPAGVLACNLMHKKTLHAEKLCSKNSTSPPVSCGQRVNQVSAGSSCPLFSTLNLISNHPCEPGIRAAACQSESEGY